MPYIFDFDLCLHFMTRMQNIVTLCLFGYIQLILGTMCVYINSWFGQILQVTCNKTMLCTFANLSRKSTYLGSNQACWIITCFGFSFHPPRNEVTIFICNVNNWYHMFSLEIIDCTVSFHIFMNRLTVCQN